MSARTAAWMAWSLFLVCVVLATASPILGLLNGHTLAEIFTAWSGPSIVALATLIVSFSVVGALIASHRPENPIGWIFLAVGFFQGLLSSADRYAVYALLTNPNALPLGAEASWLGQWIWAPGLGLILVFLPLLFPDGHPPSRRWRPLAWLGGLSIGLTVVSSTIGLWPERGPALVTGDENPSHVENVLVGFIAVPMLFVAGLGPHARRDGPGGTERRTGRGGEGDDAACACLIVVASRYSSQGWADRLAAGGSLTPKHGVVPTLGKMRHVHACFALHLSSQFDPYTAERL